MTYYILCTITCIISYPIPISILLFISYILFYHIFSYTILYCHILYICVFTLTIELAFTKDSRGNLVMFVIPYIFILYFSYTILSYDFHILCFSYTVLSYYLSYTFRVIDTLFLVLVYLSYIFLFHIMYLFIYFSCIVLCTFHILSYTVLCPFHILSYTMYFSYIVIFHILSSCTLLLVLVTVYYHRIPVLCFSYHVIYSIHFICIYLSFSFRFYVCKYHRNGYGK